MSNNYEFRHAAEADAPDFAMIGFDLMHIGINLIGKDVDDRERFVNALTDAAMLCFEVDDLKKSMMELYKRMEGMK